MSDLYRLVYASKNLLDASESETRVAVERILEASRRNNARAGVTGALMFNDGAFAQVLEGPQKGVEDTFERIQRDLRHGDVTVLECRPVTERRFSEWSMAFVGRSTTGRAEWSRLAIESGFDLRRLDGDQVFAMLHNLVLEEEGMAVSPPESSPEPLPRMLDAERLRQEIAPLIPSQAARPELELEPKRKPEPEPETPRLTHETVTIAILKAALAEERERISALRAELDTLRVAVAESGGRLDRLREQRDFWCYRSRLLAMAFFEEAADAAANATGLDASNSAVA